MCVAIPRFNVLGVGFHAMNLAIARQAILDAVANQRKGYVCLSTVHSVGEARRDPALRHILNHAFLNTTDGMPLVWLGRHHLGPQVERVYGPDLMLALLEATRDGQVTHYFYGGAPGVAEALRARLEKRFPGVRIVGVESPPFRPLHAAEQRALQERVAATAPDLFWVGLGAPKQDRFMAEYLPQLPTIMMLGVGAAFDFHSGRVRQAPRWMQRSGLEWLFRLGSEPRRLWRRYLVYNPLFVGRVALQLTRLRRYPLTET